MTINIIGVDPGPATGILTLHWADLPDLWWPPVINAYQCSAATAPGLLNLLLDTYQDDGWTAGQMEHFVHGNLPNSPVTVRLEDELGDVAEAWGLHLTRRPMATVKPWATEKRMKAAGLIAAIPAKMVDCRAAGKHAMQCAVRDADVPDPLSKAGRKAAIR
jgi:hypothetical protein